jgi:hypothetical protein
VAAEGDNIKGEDKMRQALALPCPRIRQVASIVDKHGPHAVFLPDDGAGSRS